MSLACLPGMSGLHELAAQPGTLLEDVLRVQAPVSSVEEALEMQRRGSKTRQKAGTALNYASSRSHAVFTIVLQAAADQHSDVRTCLLSNLHDVCEHSFF